MDRKASTLEKCDIYSGVEVETENMCGQSQCFIISHLKSAASVVILMSFPLSYIFSLKLKNTGRSDDNKKTKKG